MTLREEIDMIEDRIEDRIEVRECMLQQYYSRIAHLNESANKTEKALAKDRERLKEDGIGVRECMLQQYHSRIAHLNESANKTEKALAKDRERLKEVIKLSGVEEPKWIR